MRLLEYEAKQLLHNAGVTRPEGKIIIIEKHNHSSGHYPSLPVVVKSQVITGGRGKAGGVQLVHDERELRKAIKRISTLPINGLLPTSLLVEQAVSIDKELYLSLMINRAQAGISLVAHRDGGAEVELNESDGFLTLDMTSTNPDVAGEALAELYGLPEKTFLLQDLVQKLYNCFVKNDATLLEINPLILTKQGELVAGDCKMILDDAAAFRHPDWDFEHMPVSANFVTLDTDGTVATIANGAGLAMATVDAVTAAGYTPANFLDIGGNATTEQIISSFTKIMQFPRVDAIVINIFGGIVRCDTVAQAIIEAKLQTPKLPRLIIRLSGNRSQEAAALLHQHGLILHADLAECIEVLQS